MKRRRQVRRWDTERDFKKMAGSLITPGKHSDTQHLQSSRIGENILLYVDSNIHIVAASLLQSLATLNMQH